MAARSSSFVRSVVGFALALGLLAVAQPARAQLNPTGDAILTQILVQDMKTWGTIAQGVALANDSLRTAQTAVAMTMEAKEIGSSVLTLDGDRLRAVGMRSVNSVFPDAQNLMEFAKTGRLPSYAGTSLSYALIECSGRLSSRLRAPTPEGTSPAPAPDATVRSGASGFTDAECQAVLDEATLAANRRTLAARLGISERELCERDAEIALSAATSARIAAQNRADLERAAQDQGSLEDAKLLAKYRDLCRKGDTNKCNAAASLANVLAAQSTAEQTELLRRQLDMAVATNDMLAADLARKNLVAKRAQEVQLEQHDIQRCRYAGDQQACNRANARRRRAAGGDGGRDAAASAGTSAEVAAAGAAEDAARARFARCR